MCRLRVVESVAAHAGSGTDESLPSSGVVISAEPWATADFALHLTCLLLLLFFLAAVTYYAYRRRQEVRRTFRTFSTQTDRDLGTRDDLDRVIRSVEVLQNQFLTLDREVGTREELERAVRSINSLQNQVLTMELERDSERRLAQLRRSRSVSHEQLHANGLDVSVDFKALP